MPSSIITARARDTILFFIVPPPVFTFFLAHCAIANKNYTIRLADCKALSMLPHYFPLPIIRLSFWLIFYKARMLLIQKTIGINQRAVWRAGFLYLFMLTFDGAFQADFRSFEDADKVFPVMEQDDEPHSQQNPRLRHAPG
jgi:hypothetical protein